MEKSEFELVVSPGRQSIFFVALAAIFFTCMFFFIYEAIVVFYQYGVGNATVRLAAAQSEIIVICLVFGLRFSTVKDLLIDADRDLLISRFRIGPFACDFRQKCPQLEYVSVFRSKRDMFEVNLWYRKNRHYKMYEFEDAEMAFAFARIAAAKLKVDLLDATVANNSKWLDL